MDHITTRDESGTYTGRVRRVDPYDGWVSVIIETAPASRQMWIGNRLDFPPSQIVETVTS